MLSLIGSVIVISLPWNNCNRLENWLAFRLIASDKICVHLEAKFFYHFLGTWTNVASISTFSNCCWLKPDFDFVVHLLIDFQLWNPFSRKRCRHLVTFRLDLTHFVSRRQIRQKLKCLREIHFRRATKFMIFATKKNDKRKSVAQCVAANTFAFEFERSVQQRRPWNKRQRKWKRVQTKQRRLDPSNKLFRN